MAVITPFPGYLVRADLVEMVATPAYDALTGEERLLLAETNPLSFLNVLRGASDFPVGQRPTPLEAARVSRAHLERLIAEGVFLPHHRETLYLYRLSHEGHSQTGVVADLPVSEYDRGTVKVHEHTRVDREEELTLYVDVVRVSSSPVCLAYRRRDTIDAVVARLVATGPPVIDFDAPDGLRQEVWVVDEPRDVAALVAEFSRVDALYLTDGHHRAAAASRHAAARRADGDEGACQSMLVALFPDTELNILDFNRCIHGLHGRSTEDLLAELEPAFHVESLGAGDPEEARPRRRGTFGMFLGGERYRLTARPGIIPEGDPVRSLDVVVLQDNVLGPLLGIRDPRSDPRIEYVAGDRGLGGLVAHCTEPDDAAFAVFPTGIEDLMSIAETDDVMPPKSTYFSPKLRSGIFLRLRD